MGSLFRDVVVCVVYVRPGKWDIVRFVMLNYAGSVPCFRVIVGKSWSEWRGVEGKREGLRRPDLAVQGKDRLTVYRGATDTWLLP